MPTWVHVGANIGPCWLKKTVLAGLGPFWRPLGPSCLEAGGGLGGRSPPSTASGWLRDYGSNVHEFRSLNRVQNPGQIVAKMVQNRGLEGVWGAFGRLWGRSWVSSGSEAPVGRFLGASWAALGRFLRRLGRLLGGSWAVLGTKLGRPGASWRHFGCVWLGFLRSESFFIFGFLFW